MTPALEFRAASLARGGRTVLTGLDLVVPRGAFVGVLGANGAGKTTLLQSSIGLVAPVAGQALLFGEPAASARGRAGYLPQSGQSAADLRLSGWDFVAACAGGAGWGVPLLDRAQRADVARVLALTDAAGYAHRPVCALSGGERQRLMLAQALLGSPGLLVLDEPLAGLDPQHQAATVALVRGLQRRLGITVLFSAHDLGALLPALDLVLYLGGGQAALGTVDEVVTGPVLSRLYGAPMRVIRAGGGVFVVADRVPVGEDAHAFV